jgi:CRP/FNR family transcriptional regulator
MWLEQFDDLKKVADPAWKQALSEVSEITVAAGTVLFQSGDTCKNYLFLCSGSVKVISLSPEGREVVLYHIGPGQTCILTSSCLLGDAEYPAQGVAEQEVHAAAMPREVFNRLLSESAGFRRFVFGQMGNRMAKLMYLVQEIAFDRTHVRLAKKLQAIAGPDGTAHLTHADLAVELGTVREVVSRLLKDFERKGLVQLSRGGIRILDANALARQSEM